MPGISGSDKALMYALGGVARGGATRGGYHSPKVFVTIGGTHFATGRTAPSASIDYGSLIVEKTIGQPHTAQFNTRGFVPSVGQEVVVTLGSKNTLRRVFGGQIVSAEESYNGAPENYTHRVSALDFTWGIDAVLVTGRYTGTATAIAEALMDEWAPSGFTANNVQASLATVTDGITFTNQPLGSALSQLAKRIGAYWYIDYYKDLHFFTTDTSVTAPRPVVDGLSTFRNAPGGFMRRRSIASMVTRVYVEGGGARALAPVAAGETIIPVDTADWYVTAAPGTVKAGPQHITFTGVETGGGGSIVGPGVGPVTAPTSTQSSGGSTGVPAGSPQYAVTYTTAAGESLPSPTLTVTVGTIAAPSTAPTLGTPSAGTGPDDGTHGYAVTFTDDNGGETTASTLASVTTETIATPTVAAVFYGLASEYQGSTAMTAGVSYDFAYVWSLASASNDYSQITAPGPEVAHVAVENTYFTALGVTATRVPQITVGVNSDPRVRWIHLVRRETGAGAAAWRVVASMGNGAISNTETFYEGAGNANGAALPAPAAHLRTVAVSNIPTGASVPGVTGRKLYRTEAGSAQLKLLVTLPNITATSYSDIWPDAFLGANVPAANTAVTNQVNLANLPIGGSTVTGRKVYRTPVGSAQLKLLTTIADNTTVVFADAFADASLGANVPVSDTSALAGEDGTVTAGSTSVLVAGTGAFESAGGWAIVGNGQQILRYTGISSSALTGVPTSGTGSITANISYGSTISAAPQLTGVPASGTGSVAEALLQGEDVNLWVQVDDEDAQRILADLTGGTGIVEDFIQDRRLSYEECVARGTAHLDLLAQVEETLQYPSLDLNNQPGSLVSVELTAPGTIDRDFRIQKVSMSKFHPSIMPTHVVTGSSLLFSFEDLLNLARKGA